MNKKIKTNTFFLQHTVRTQEEAVNCFLSNCNDKIKKWEDYLKHPEKYLTPIGCIPNVDKIKFRIEVLKRAARFVANRKCEKALWYRFQSKNCFRYIEGKGLYIDEHKAHNIIRIYDSPSIQFFSFEEMITWIENHRSAVTSNTAHVNEYEINKLKEYWDKYPNSMVFFH